MNPCLGVNGFLGLVLDAIPQREMTDKAESRSSASACWVSGRL